MYVFPLFLPRRCARLTVNSVAKSWQCFWDGHHLTERSSLRISDFDCLIMYEKLGLVYFSPSKKVWFLKNKEKTSSSDFKKKRKKQSICNLNIRDVAALLNQCRVLEFHTNILPSGKMHLTVWKPPRCAQFIAKRNRNYSMLWNMQII